MKSCHIAYIGCKKHFVFVFVFAGVCVSLSICKFSSRSLISFHEIYGLYGLEHHTVEIKGDVAPCRRCTIAGITVHRNWSPGSSHLQQSKTGALLQGIWFLSNLTAHFYKCRYCTQNVNIYFCFLDVTVFWVSFSVSTESSSQKFKLLFIKFTVFK